MHKEAIKDQKLLRLAGVISKTGLGKTTIYKSIRDGKFPKPLHPTGGRLSAWEDSEIDRWIADQVAASREPQGNS